MLEDETYDMKRSKDNPNFYKNLSFLDSFEEKINNNDVESGNELEPRNIKYKLKKIFYEDKQLKM